MKKPVKKPVVTRPGRNGGTLRNGSLPGTNRGGAGRPTNDFKARMRALADLAAQTLELSTILSDPEHPDFLNAAKWVADRGYGKVKDQVEHSGEVGARVVRLPMRAPDSATWAAWAASERRATQS